MVKGLGTSAHQLRKDVGHKTGLKGILFSLKLNLGQNNCLYMEKRVAKKLLPLPF